MSFDFDAYLAQIGPSHTWSVQHLQGGLVNLTVRAVKISSSEDGIKKGLFNDRESLILKFAPPYVAALGESAPFSQTRQTVEANALSLFSPPSGPLFSLPLNSSVLVPKLIHYDPENHVLILEDLGNLLTLSEYLTPFSEKYRHSRYDIGLCRQIGLRLGQFLADLHSRSTLDSLTPETVLGFENPSMIEIVREAAVLPIAKYLQMFEIQEAEQLAEVVAEDFELSFPDAEKSFTVGDLWTGGILISGTKMNSTFSGEGQVETKVNGNEANIGVIDWEFAGPGAGVYGDMAQLFAHLHLHLLAAEQGSLLHEITKVLIEAIADSYHERSRLKRAIWIVADLAPDEKLSASKAPQGSSSAARILRSAFILHGREIINNAIERDWSAFYEKSGTGEDENVLVRSMVQTGAWYLRAAKETVEQFVSDENWRHLCSAKEGSIMMRLLTGLK
ncbi:kinase-like domain-containing protein [Lipomyces doorenjongii]